MSSVASEARKTIAGCSQLFIGNEFVAAENDGVVPVLSPIDGVSQLGIALPLYISKHPPCMTLCVPFMFVSVVFVEIVRRNRPCFSERCGQGGTSCIPMFSRHRLVVS